MDTHGHQLGHVLYGPQILGVHDVGAVLVLIGGHQFARTVLLLEQEDRRLVGTVAVHIALDPRRAVRGPDLGGPDGGTHRHDVAGLGFPGLVGVVLPAAGIGAGALVGIPVIHIAGQQAPARVGDAQGPVDEDLDLHIGALVANLADFLQGQLPGENHPLDALLAPEFHRCVVDGVGLHRQVDRHLGPLVPHQHDESRVRHDQGVRFHVNHRFHVPQIGFHLVVVGGDITGDVELLALGVGLRHGVGHDVEVVELVVAHPKAIAGLAGVDGIGAIGKGIAHVSGCPGRG